MSAKYKKVLPISDDAKVVTQIGYLPLSVMEFSKAANAKWKSIAHYEQDEHSMRRSTNSEYLPGLQHSEFPPAQAEFILKYWSLKGSRVVDPFAGRATRAVMATKLNRKYYGYEISPRTYKNSIEHFKKIGIENEPTLYLSDGCKLSHTEDNFADLVMTCPPYHSLEKYESVDGQLSDCASYDEFLKSIFECAKNIHRVMKPGSFCVWVIADWRDSKGYRPFTKDSHNIFKAANLFQHDEIIVKNQSPFAALQAGKCAAKRISSKIHEVIQIYKKPGEYIIPDYCSEDDINEKANEFFDI
jgi:DNA modification methylase